MADGVVKLKELLLDKEQRALGELHARFDTLFDRTGTSERLKQSVAEVLAGAFREAETRRESHSELASAVSPVILDTVRREVRASADDLAQALHPHMGRMISAYVASAIKDMMAKMNSQLESGLSPKRWAIKAKSLVTGNSEAALLLADMNALRLQELYLIRRGSGDLISHWEDVGAGVVAGAAIDIPKSDAAAMELRSNRDTVISAFLTAINDFAREAFAASEGGLQAVDVQSHRIYMRSSPTYLLAAKCSGISTPQAERLLDQEFANAIEANRAFLSTQFTGHDATELQTLLPDLAGRMQSGLEVSGEHSGSKPNLAKWFLILLASGLIGWLSWDKWVSWQTERTRTAVETVLTNSVMGSYVSGVDVERGGQLVRLKGLAPSQADKAAVLDAIDRSIRPARIEDRIEILPQQGDGGVQAVRRNIQESAASLSLAATQRAIQRTRYLLQQISVETERLVRETTDGPARPQLQAVTSRVTSARTELEDLWKPVSQANAIDDLGALRPAIAAVMVQVGQAKAGLAKIRGQAAPPELVRPAAATELHTRVREEAELIATATDGLSSELAVTERFLLRQTIAQLSGRILPPSPPVVQTAPAAIPPRQVLVQWAQSHAVFFSVDSNFRDTAEAAATLDQLARVLGRTDALLRVVGYTDEAGTTARNSGIALDRATKVRQALIDRGVPAQRLVAIGRPNGQNVSQATGLNSPNRRVEFEVGFDEEKSGG